MELEVIIAIFTRPHRGIEIVLKYIELVLKYRNAFYRSIFISVRVLIVKITVSTANDIATRKQKLC